MTKIATYVMNMCINIRKKNSFNRIYCVADTKHGVEEDRQIGDIRTLDFVLTFIQPFIE